MTNYRMAISLTKPLSEHADPPQPRNYCKITRKVVQYTNQMIEEYCSDITHHSLDVPVAAPKRRGSGASDAIPLVYLVRSVEQPAMDYRDIRYCLAGK